MNIYKVDVYDGIEKVETKTFKTIRRAHKFFDKVMSLGAIPKIRRKR